MVISVPSTPESILALCATILALCATILCAIILALCAIILAMCASILHGVELQGGDVREATEQLHVV
jgi:hypothetical protein